MLLHKTAATLQHQSELRPESDCGDHGDGRSRSQRFYWQENSTVGLSHDKTHAIKCWEVAARRTLGNLANRLRTQLRQTT